MIKILFICRGRPEGPFAHCGNTAQTGAFCGSVAGIKIPFVYD